jgi:uncharacterized caspase-like protein
MLKYIVLCFIFCATYINVFAQKIYVVSVGVADYKEINDLRFTENDVLTFNQIIGNYTDKIATLVGSQATHANVIKTIRAVFSKATPNDVVMFFFSGHGYEGGFCCYDMRASSFIGGISYKEMQILFRNCRAGIKMIFADACFSGGLSRQKTHLTVQSVQNSEVLYFLSSKFDETSLELPNGPNGLYTYWLAHGLKGDSDTNNDGKISLQEIYDYVYNSVVTYTNQIPHDQHPMIWGRFDKNMTILNYK